MVSGILGGWVGVGVGGLGVAAPTESLITRCVHNFLEKLDEG